MTTRAIDWFPGHMATARKEATETMRKTDVVIEVLDARVPSSSTSPLVAELRRMNQRPALKLLNKADVADAARTDEWLAAINAVPHTRAIAVSAKGKGLDAKRLVKECSALAPGRGTRLKPLRLMILGIPNVGKSTLMNTLLRRHVAKVGDEPAITKHQVRHELLPAVFLVDTPGMLWPGVDQGVAMKLAATHSIGRNAYDEETVALWLAAALLERYAGLLADRYGALPDACTPEELLEHVAKRRGIVDGGKPGGHRERAAVVLLNEFRAGTLGRITLETVADVAGTERVA